MKRRRLLIALFTLLIIAAGIGGTLTARAFLMGQKNPKNPPTSLYLTGARVIPTIKVPTSMTHDSLSLSRPQAMDRLSCIMDKWFLMA